jgi:regulator of nucleoside diphosphate kinase
MSNTKHQRPPIVVADDEHERLVDLALSAMHRMPGAADLFVELSRAKTVQELPIDAIGIDSVVTFVYDGAHYTDFALVDPHRADFANGRISIVTSVGAMLLGLSEGQTIEWTGEDGRFHWLTVDRVRQPAARPTPSPVQA